jgi:hypothetical protein
MEYECNMGTLVRDQQEMGGREGTRRKRIKVYYISVSIFTCVHMWQ